MLKARMSRHVPECAARWTGCGRIVGFARPCKANIHVRCRQHVLPRLASLDPALADEVMLRVVARLPLLAGQDAGITDFLRTLPFVPTAAGARKAPSELHDPRYAAFIKACMHSAWLSCTPVSAETALSERARRLIFLTLLREPHWLVP